MSPEEAGSYGVRSVIRSTAGGPPIGLRKRARKKFPRPSAEASVMPEEGANRPVTLADRAKERVMGAEERRPMPKKFKRKTERRRMY